MGILEPDRPGPQVPRLDFELVAGCDHKCGHCYNVWNAADDTPQGGYKRGHLDTAAYLAMMDKTISTSGAQHVTITGGEPLLHKGALDIIDKACERCRTVTVITNGSHVTPEAARRMATAGVSSVQLTLLSADRDEHDRLKGSACFDDTIEAVVTLREAGVHVQICFVATQENADGFEAVFDLVYALGVDLLSYNRMSPTGWAAEAADRLLPTIEQIEDNLEVANRLGPAYGVRVATAMPIPPCLIRTERYPWVQIGFCSTGTSQPNLTVDPAGNVRSCNLSSHIMGNVVERDWDDIHADKYFHTFKKQVPDICRGCRYEHSCQGGCKESGFATYGDLTHPEPLLARMLEERGDALPPPGKSARKKSGLLRVLQG